MFTIFQVNWTSQLHQKLPWRKTLTWSGIDGRTDAQTNIHSAYKSKKIRRQSNMSCYYIKSSRMYHIGGAKTMFNDLLNIFQIIFQINQIHKRPIYRNLKKK